MKLAIEGDLRFISHHDTMRAFERISSRAELPLKYSQGFNPRPVFSLSCPRPVGVTTQDDRLVFALNGCMEPADLLAGLNKHSLEGLRFLSCRLVEKSEALQPKSVAYEIPLPTDILQQVKMRVEALQQQPAWEVQRKLKPKRGKKPKQDSKTVDIKPMLSGLEVTENVLRFVCNIQEGRSARPGEVLTLVGLAGPEYLAELVRTKIEDGF